MPLQKIISVVIPVYNEIGTLPVLTERVAQVIAQLPQFQWEVVYVNDNSSDGSEKLLPQLAEKYPWLSVIHFSRNFGHQIAITAGIDYAQGDAVVVMDGDLQDPPELIPEMVELWQEGFDVVYATRQQREGESLFKLLTASLFYRLFRKMSEVKIPLDTGDFRLMSRPVVNALSQMREKSRFIRGMVSWVGFSQTSLLYERDKRYEGETKYTLFKMMRFAMDGLLSFSKVPLQWITTLGFIISASSFIGILLVLYQTMVLHDTIRGWSSLMVVVLFLGGVQLICVGMVGEYVARIFDEVRQRPLYLIQRIDSRRMSNTASESLSEEIQLYDHSYSES